jgi:hypothetical protein
MLDDDYLAEKYPDIIRKAPPKESLEEYKRRHDQLMKLRENCGHLSGGGFVCDNCRAQIPTMQEMAEWENKLRAECITARQLLDRLPASCLWTEDDLYRMAKERRIPSHRFGDEILFHQSMVYWLSPAKKRSA